MLIDRFRQEMSRLTDLRDQERILLAVSGGIDSVVMTDLCSRCRIPAMLLHCNFQLRGNESDADESFVRSLASHYDFPVFVRSFETEKFAGEQGISVQMAARQLRYDWFDEVSEKQHSRYIATAHNLDDSVETIFLNLARGTGMRGLTGIPSVNGTYIRPLLFARRTEIARYAAEWGINYREDSSNASKKYHRNKVRHDIIPVFEEINPAFLKTMAENAKHVAESIEILARAVSEVRNRLFDDRGDHIAIDTVHLKQLEPRSTWLFELFSPYNFNRDQCLSIGSLLDSPSGKQFVSTSHSLHKDRNHLLLYPNAEQGFERYYIDSPDRRAALPFPMDIDTFPVSELTSFPDSGNIAMFDLDRIEFPLVIRKWADGDFFFPLGMEHMKKLSDFFVDEKIPVPGKKRAWIMTSGGKIAWIMGMRIDNRFKVTDQTSMVLKLHMHS